MNKRTEKTMKMLLLSLGVVMLLQTQVEAAPSAVERLAALKAKRAEAEAKATVEADAGLAAEKKAFDSNVAEHFAGRHAALAERQEKGRNTVVIVEEMKRKTMKEIFDATATNIELEGELKKLQAEHASMVKKSDEARKKLDAAKNKTDGILKKQAAAGTAAGSAEEQEQLLAMKEAKEEQAKAELEVKELSQAADAIVSQIEVTQNVLVTTKAKVEALEKVNAQVRVIAD